MPTGSVFVVFKLLFIFSSFATLNVDMKKYLVYFILAAIVIIGVFVAYSMSSKKTSTGIQSECSQYSNKDGYTGCMSLMNGKDKKCKFKVDNKVNPQTQKMEFTYSCVQK